MDLFVWRELCAELRELEKKIRGAFPSLGELVQDGPVFGEGIVTDQPA